MAYDKHTWTCNEPITVERLNHIEDGIAAGGDCDCGFECETTIALLTEETVTTVASEDGNVGQFSYSQSIDADTIKVTFSGTEYECPRMQFMGANAYGGLDTSTGSPDFSQYPFAIVSHGLGNMLGTETAGTYAIKIEAVVEAITTTPCFDKARGYSCSEEWVTLTEESVTPQPVKDDDYAVASLSYSQLIDAETIKVTFNGTEYECVRTGAGSSFSYGDPNLSTYPFAIFSSGELGNTLRKTTSTLCTIKIEAEQEVATTTQCFKKAVEKCLPEMPTFDSAKASIPTKAIGVDFYSPAPGVESIASKSTRQIHFSAIDISRYGNNFLDAVVKSFSLQGIDGVALLPFEVSVGRDVANNTVSVSAQVYNPYDNAVTLSTTASRVSIAVFYVNTTNVRDICYLQGNCISPDPDPIQIE